MLKRVNGRIYKFIGICEKCGKQKEVVVLDNHTYCIKHALEKLDENSNDYFELKVYYYIKKIREMKEKILEYEKELYDLIDKEVEG